MTSFAHIALAGVAAVTIAAASLHAQDDKADKADEMIMPKSMDEFVNWHFDNAKFGDWTETGVTKDMWVGIPAGLDYTSTMSITLSDDRTRILRNYMMATDDGRVVSTGSGFTYWDEKTKAPVATSSGFDMGKPYHGTSTLVGINIDTAVWEYTEHSQGKTSVYRDSQQVVNPTMLRNSVKKKGAEGKPWVSELTRVNHLKAHGLDALVGGWSLEMPDGSVMRTGTSWAVGQQAIVSRSAKSSSDGTRVSEGMSVLFWDPSAMQINSIYFGPNGGVYVGIVASAKKEGDKLTLVTLYGGNNTTEMSMTTVFTQVIEGDSMTNTFSDVTINGAPHAFGWANVPMIHKRAEQRRRRPNGDRAR